MTDILPLPDDEPTILPFSAEKQEKPFVLRDDIRAAIAVALDPANDTPENQRLKKLQAAIESGDVAEVVDSMWVTRCYETYREMDVEPYVRKSDLGNRAIALSQKDMKDLGTLAYISDTGDEIVMDDQSMVDNNVQWLVVLPNEVGN